MKEKEIRLKIQQLLDSQLLAALSTQKKGQPYTNLIAFVSTDNLRTVLFATTKSTRKYDNLVQEPRVSMLVDCRNNKAGDFHQASAVTVMGEAHEVGKEESVLYVPTFIARHPYLEHFVNSPSSALIKVNVKHYILVSNFQKVMELHLTDESDIFPK